MKQVRGAALPHTSIVLTEDLYRRLERVRKKGYEINVSLISRDALEVALRRIEKVI